jgi:nicotinamide-nucleotide amidase
MFAPELLSLATNVLAQARAEGIAIATAESCTGGLIAGLLTEIPGSSDVFERGFVTYSNKSKEEMLGVPAALLRQHGAVSEAVARAMAEGAIRHSTAQLAVAVTGIAGPGGGTEEKPVGLVHIATARAGEATRICECRFGDIGREAIRRATVRAALLLLQEMLP